jgi:uncharacterized protein
VTAAFTAQLTDGRCGYALVNARTGQRIAGAVEGAVTRAARRKGLLGRDRLDDDAALVIAPCSAIHMFHMRFPIDVVFVDENGTTVRVVRDLRPWRIAAARGAHAAIEMAAGVLATKPVSVGDRLVLE